MTSLRTRSALAALIALCCGATGLAAQEPAPVAWAPVTVSVPQVAGNGHAETWDGRVFVLARSRTAALGPRQGWVAIAIRPEGLGRRPDGAPDFQAGTFSPEAVLEGEGDPNTGMDLYNALAITPAPGFEENPFRSDATGRADPSGAFETYELVVTTQTYDPPLDRFLGARRGRIVVRNPRTAQAAIESARFLAPNRQLRGSDGQPLRGIEPTLTFDGHLMVWQGHPDNDGKIDMLMYSVNQTPGALNGWSPPRPLSDLYWRDRDTRVAGIPLARRYPLAAQPLRAADGAVFQAGDLYRGAYPWISQDGSELFHMATVAGRVGIDRARRGGFSAIGRFTGWRLRLLDGPLNPNREATVRLFFSSPGLAPGLWRPWRDVPSVPIPSTGGRPVYPLFGSNTRDYGEASFEDHEDGENLLALDMNELVRKNGTIDPLRTPDTSGRGLTGELQGAQFPLEHDGQDRNLGRVGQAVVFPDAGLVRVRGAGPTLEEARRALTVELWVQRSVDLARDAADRRRYLLHLPHGWNLVLLESGLVQATVRVGDRDRRAPAVGPALAVGRWTHVAFTYTAADGRLRTWIDGELRGEQVFGPGEIDRPDPDLLIGPGGQSPAAPFLAPGQAIVLLDQLKVARVARSADELAAHAFRPAAPVAFPGRLPDPLPRGLAPADLRLRGNVSREQADLGRLLFFDPRLSRTQQVSCATCHRPELHFTDGLARSVGVSGAPLDRNAPTVVNRAFGTAQFWDGRAASLEAQALVPIVHPDEMGLPLAEALAFLRSAPDYVTRFERAFGPGGITGARLQVALAQFQRTLLSGDSRVDRFEAGQRGALDASEQRGRLLFQGRARCVACHQGSNYSDEAFHASGFFDLAAPGADRGLQQTTGRARDRGRLKTPSLRDVARTAPYLHDGSLRTLEEVVRRYVEGDFFPGSDPELRPLDLSPQDERDLVAFLRALDGAPLNVVPPALPAGPDERFVEALYRDLLGRAPNATGLSGWTARLRQGTSRAAVAQAFLDSPEYATRRVEAEYLRLLRRAADPAGRDNWARRLQASGDWEGFLVALTTSTEYRAKFPPDAPWLQQLYLDLLGRAADQGGLASHLIGLQASNHDFAREARAFVDSRERHQRLAAQLYRALLGRAASVAERDALASELDRGLTERAATIRLCGSDEYYRRSR